MINTNKETIEEFKRRAKPKNQIDTLLYSNSNGQLIEYPDSEYEIDPEKVIQFISKALEAKDLQAKKLIDNIVELFRLTHKQEIKELIEDVPFQGRIEDAADFQNRLSEWREIKLDQYK